jgi:tellurite resistance protein TerC
MILQTADPTRSGRCVSLQLRRIALAIAGFGVLALGLVLVVVPVPGTSIVVIPLGFTILAKEFAWARRALAWATCRAKALWFAVRQMFGRRLLPVPAR